jgi:hypothetical protein
MFALGIFGMFGSMILPLIFFALIFVSIRAIVMTVRIPARVSREPACEVCRYRIAGLSTFTCPECGTDLRATGIVTLPMEVRRRGSMLAAICGWIYLMFLLGGITLGAISAFMFAPAMSAMTGGGGSMTTTTPLTPASAAYTRIDTIATINYGATVPGGTTGTTDYELVLKDGSVWKLAYPPVTGNYTITDPTGAVTAAPDDGKGADALFAAAGLDMTDAKVAAEARELSAVESVMAASPWTSVSTIKLRVFTPGAPAMTGPMVMNPPDQTGYYFIMIICAVVWFGLLAGGIVFIVVKRKRLLRKYATVAVKALA